MSEMDEGATASSVWPPTDVESYHLCPARWWYTRRYGRAGTAEMAIGGAAHAVAAGVEVEDAVAALAAEWDPAWTHSVEGAGELVKRGAGMVKGAIQELDAVEVPMEVELTVGRCRIDRVARAADGLVVTDWKFKISMDRRNLGYEIERADVSHQLRHEAWAASQHFGERVVRARMAWVVLGPRPFTYPHVVDVGEGLDGWVASAADTWAEMDRYSTREIPAPRNPNSCNAFRRPCEFYDICWRLHGDVGKGDRLMGYVPGANNGA